MSKYAAPTIVSLIVIGLVVGYATMLYFLINSTVDISLVIKIIIAAVSLFVIGATLAVLIQRIKELKGGKENDISQY